MTLRWFVIASSPTDEEAIASELRSLGCDVLGSSEAVYVVGHFDVVACSGSVPTGITADVVVYIACPVPDSGDHGGAVATVTVASVGGFKELLVDQPWLSGP